MPRGYAKVEDPRELEVLITADHTQARVDASDNGPSDPFSEACFSRTEQVGLHPTLPYLCLRTERCYH